MGLRRWVGVDRVVSLAKARWLASLGWLGWLVVAVACDGPAAVTPPRDSSAEAAGSGGSTVTPLGSSDGSPPRATPTAPEVTLKPGGEKAIEGRRGMVASEDELATRIGAAVLERGGNAVDAAVAVGYALSVTHHAAGSLGGGGFMMVHLASGEVAAIDYREVAPSAATVAANEKQLAAGAHGYLSAPVPGVVAGLNLAHAKYGSLPLGELLAPAIALSDKGHRYGERQARVLSWFWDELRKDPTLRAIFGRGPKRDKPLAKGQLLLQPALAETLRAIADHGNDGFYRGPVAEKIAKAMKARGGLVTMADLAGYEAKVREPLHLSYRGLDVYTMPPPSMGGIALYGILMNLAQVKAHEAAAGSALGLHYFVEAEKRAYADRRAIGADPDHPDAVAVAPLRERLLSSAYYAAREPAIVPDKATPSTAVIPIHDAPAGSPESPDTTHFSVTDASGNAVACTTTLSAAFGARVAVPGTGVLFSNAMGAFSPTGVNVLAKGKRMASSMTPTLVLSGGRAVAVLGSPGGDTIPGTVAQVLRNLVDWGMTIDRAIEHGRIHHQHLPDVVRLEQARAPAADVQAALRQRGHRLELSGVLLGDTNGIVLDPAAGVAWGYADSRKGGLAAGPPAR